ncbi:hypothetical protein FRB99_006628 [Tulasnella sp. 403]|nr:hypothetical protein FRB99_006628 [Tulasnella sp. 403]
MLSILKRYYNYPLGRPQHEPAPQAATSLMYLPPELVLYTAQFVSKRYEPRHEGALANSDLTALASTCRSLRHVLLPFLFEDVTVHSSSRLTAFSKAPAHILGFVRAFTVQLDLDFYETWIWSLDHRQPSNPTRQARSPPKPNHPSQVAPAKRKSHSTADPLYALSLILLRTAPTLRAFSFVMRNRPDSSGSAWSQFPRPGMAGIPFASQLIPTMIDLLPHLSATMPSDKIHSSHISPFPELHTLSLDGTADILPLLALTPKLTTLRLRIPEGFNATDSRNIIYSLANVPRLRRLEMWVWELGTVITRDDVVNRASAAPGRTPPTADEISKERTRLFSLIGQSCPHLEWLGFQTRTFDYADGSMNLRVVPNRGFDWRDLIPALPHFPSLLEVQFPGSLYTRDESRKFVLGSMSGTVPGVTATSGVPAASSAGVRGSTGSVGSGVHSGLPPATHLGKRGQVSQKQAQPFASNPIVSSPTQAIQHLTTLLHHIQSRECHTSAHLMRASHIAGGKLERVSWVREESTEDNGIVEYELVRPSSSPLTSLFGGDDSLGDLIDLEETAFVDQSVWNADDPSERIHARPSTRPRPVNKEYRSYLLDPDWYTDELRTLRLSTTSARQPESLWTTATQHLRNLLSLFRPQPSNVHTQSSVAFIVQQFLPPTIPFFTFSSILNISPWSRRRPGQFTATSTRSYPFDRSIAMDPHLTVRLDVPPSHSISVSQHGLTPTSTTPLAYTRPHARDPSSAGVAPSRALGFSFNTLAFVLLGTECFLYVMFIGSLTLAFSGGAWMVLHGTKKLSSTLHSYIELKV